MSTGGIIEVLRKWRVPEPQRPWDYAGGLTLFFLLLQAISGIMLTLHYQPSAETAHESVLEIISSIPLGWFVRAVHVWCAHLVIICALAYSGSKYFLHQYRQPHAFEWIASFVLILLFLAFAFTGHILPWDTIGYTATQIGTGILAAAPFVGSILGSFMMGGSDIVDGKTLSRMFSLHTVVFPALTVLVLSWNGLRRILLVDSPARQGRMREGDLPFYPDVVYRHALAWILGLMVLVTLATFFPKLPGPGAGLLSPAPEGVKPEWYFLPIFVALRFLPGSIAGIQTEAFVNTAAALIITALFVLPWIDRGRERLMKILGAGALIYAAASIIYAGLLL